MIQYEDFSIRIESKREDRYPVRVLGSPAGEGASDFQPAFNLDELGDILADLGQTVRGTGLRDAARVVTPGTQPRELGHQLYNALFSGSVRSLLDRSQGMLHAKDRGLRIKLHINPDDPGLAPLASLPWELLYCKETRDFLSLSHSTPVVRYLDIQRPYTPLAIEPPLRVLVVVSCPAGYQKLDLDKERELIERSWAQHAAVEVEFMEKATIRALQDRLAGQDVHVLHFMGHGDFDERSGQGVLLMENSEGCGDLVDGQALGVLLHDARTLRLVVLNACETARVTRRQGLDPFAGIATALVLAGLPAVVAMQFPISDGAAITFAESFYPLLAKGRPADYAITEARKAIYVAEPGTLEWATPVLFMRAPQGVLFEVSEAQFIDVPPARLPSPPFESYLQPQRIAEGEAGRVTVQNLGHRSETFEVAWQDPAQDLVFDPAKTELTVPQGQSTITPFRATLQRRRLFGGQRTHPFTAQVTSSAREIQTHAGEVVSKGLVPVWVAPVIVAALAFLSLFLYLLVTQPSRDPSTVRVSAQAAAQTAEAAETVTAQVVTQMAAAAETATAQVATQTAAAAETANAQTATETAEAGMTAPADILYARPEGLPYGECNSWDSACELQYALSLAEAGSRDEIWVAAGTYKPTTSRDRSATFQLADGLEIYGGFAGTEASREARDWVAYETILSGDIGTEGDSSDNSYHVLAGDGLTEGVVLDGFTITGGYAMHADTWEQRFGGGLFVYFGTLTLKNLRFERNTADVCGGGLYLNEAGATMVNVTFRDNSAEAWEGKYADPHSGGGGFCLNNGGATTLKNVTFSDNTAQNDGGGMYNWKSEPTLINVTFSHNSAGSKGGGMYNEASSPTLYNCTFSSNSASTYGGGIANYDGSSPVLTNSILWGNAPDQISNDDSTPVIRHTDIQGGCDAILGSTCDPSNIDADPFFVDADAGDLHLWVNSPATDAGNNFYVTAKVDLDGNSRIVNGQVDMGAYEFQGND